MLAYRIGRLLLDDKIKNLSIVLMIFLNLSLSSNFD